jgi:hypothetical protein
MDIRSGTGDNSAGWFWCPCPAWHACVTKALLNNQRPVLCTRMRSSSTIATSSMSTQNFREPWLADGAQRNLLSVRDVWRHQLMFVES